MADERGVCGKQYTHYGSVNPPLVCRLDAGHGGSHMDERDGFRHAWPAELSDAQPSAASVPPATYECVNCGGLVPVGETHYSASPAFGYQCERPFPASVPPEPPTLNDEPYESRLREIATIAAETCHCRDGHPAVSRSAVLWLVGEVRALRADVAALREMANECSRCRNTLALQKSETEARAAIRAARSASGEDKRDA